MKGEEEDFWHAQDRFLHGRGACVCGVKSCARALTASAEVEALPL